MDKHVLATMVRRWLDGQAISAISNREGFDRKTIRTYLRQLEARGYEPGQTDIDQQEVDRILDELLPTNRRGRSKREQLDPYRDELIRLVNPPDQPADAVKPKTAYLILKEKYGLEVSYETFKLYARQIGLAAQRNRPPTAIEQPPGQETQIDYGSVGTLADPATGTDRRVQAFAAKLSHCRLPFIQFTYTQNSESFVESNIGMVEFYGGVTECLLIDNLKSGVLKPHIWDPQINRAYAEFAEHYGTFIDTARVHTATDKAKVERLIPQARELFRRLKALHPTFTLEELNSEALRWCREEYGRTKHGTTGVEPMVLFEEAEKAILKPLPRQRFEVPLYKPVTVHADRFFIFEKKRYAMPEDCRGKSFMARKSGNLLRVFDSSYRLLRSYPISRKRVSWLPGDFPENEEALMNGTYPRYLCGQARALGPAAERLVTEILKPHAWVKARLARGVLSVLENYRASPFLQDIRHHLTNDLKRLRMPGMIDTLDLRIREATDGNFGYLEFLQLLVQDEIANREANNLAKRLKAANLSTRYTFEAFDFHFNARVLPSPTLRDLATCRFLDRNGNIILCGPPGIGKSHISQAIGHEVCRRGGEVMFTKTHKLLEQMLDAEYPRRATRLWKRVRSVQLLILDDFGFRRYDSREAELLYAICDERLGTGSIILTSNRPVEDWYSVFPDPVIGGAILDRLASGATKLIIEKGRSYRKEGPASSVASSRNSEKEAEHGLTPGICQHS